MLLGHGPVSAPFYAPDAHYKYNGKVWFLNDVYRGVGGDSFVDIVNTQDRLDHLVLPYTTIQPYRIRKHEVHYASMRRRLPTTPADEEDDFPDNESVHSDYKPTDDFT